MNANERESVVEKLIGAVYEVSNVLGAGFLEKVYERALLKELTSVGLHAQAQVRFPVIYKGQCVGEYLSDIVVENENRSGAEVCRILHQGTFGPVHQLPEGDESEASLCNQLPET